MIDINSQINIIVAFVVVFVVAYHFINIQDSYKILMLMICLGIAAYYWWNTKYQDGVIEKSSQKILDDLEGKLHQEVTNQNTYYIHRSPRKIKYIRKNKNVVQFITDLKFLEIYHNDAFHKLVTYLEHFLRIHYNVMIGVYDACSYLPILKDMRVEMLNIMASLTFNLPYQSTIIDISNFGGNMDDYIEKKTKDLDAILYRYIKIAFNKFHNRVDCRHLTYKYPAAFDTHYDNHVLFV